MRFWIVVLLSACSGWLGLLVNHLAGVTGPPLETPGALLWLATPALAGLTMRVFGGDGWRDAGFAPRVRSGGIWYGLAIAVYPLCALAVALVAALADAVSLDGLLERPGAYAKAASIVFAGSIVKNVFEEFAWRGYLTPRLDAARVPPLLNHLLVAFVWWSWHLPYYFFFLDRELLLASIATDMEIFLALSIFVLVPTSVLFGELRLASGSVWPPVLLHCVLNGLSTPLILHHFIQLKGPAAFLVSPTNEGILTALLLGLAGVGLFRYRTGK